MVSSGSGTPWTRILVIQSIIIAVVAAILAFYLPGRARREARAEAADRELRIQSFAHTMLVEDPIRQVSATGPDGETLSHAQKLLRQESVDEVQQTLGAPTAERADINGGQHLTWTGTRHQLEAAFDKGVLYNVMYRDVRTGHGVTVFESAAYFGSY